MDLLKIHASISHYLHPNIQAHRCGGGEEGCSEGVGGKCKADGHHLPHPEKKALQSLICSPKSGSQMLFSVVSSGKKKHLEYVQAARSLL